jgi:hypothetical protein
MERVVKWMNDDLAQAKRNLATARDWREKANVAPNMQDTAIAYASGLGCALASLEILISANELSLSLMANRGHVAPVNTDDDNTDDEETEALIARGAASGRSCPALLDMS